MNQLLDPGLGLCCFLFACAGYVLHKLIHPASKNDRPEPRKCDADSVLIDVVMVQPGGGEVTVIQGMTLEFLATMTLYEGQKRFSLPKRSRLTLTPLRMDEPMNERNEA